VSAGGGGNLLIMSNTYICYYTIVVRKGMATSMYIAF
jgi:hypothetical protein